MTMLRRSDAPSARRSSRVCASLEDLDRRQRLAFEELEERAAAGRDVADSLGDAVLGDRRQRVAAAGDRERRRRRRSRARALACLRANASNSNTPTGPFQTIVPAACNQRPRAIAAVCGPMSRIRSSSATSAIALIVAGASAANSFATRRRPASAPRRRGTSSSDRRVRFVDQVRLGQRLADRPPAASMKVLAMPPPTISLSTFVGQRLQDRQLGRDLRAGDDRDQRPLRVRRAPWPSASISAASSGPGAGDRRVIARCRGSWPRRGARCRTRR